MKVTPLPEVERGPAAQRRRRHLRRRPPRPPRGDRGLRQRAHLRPAPGLGGLPPAHAEAADDARAQGRAGRLARRAGDDRDPLRRRVRRPLRRASSSTTCSSARSAPAQVAIGENFRFGDRAQGDPALLSADGRFETVVHPLLEIDGEIVSSSHIRGLVLAGERRARPTACWARASSCAARSLHGDARGRELGFPTANLIPDEALVCPGHGVYACLRATADARPAVEHRRAPDLRDRPGRADRGLPARLRGRPLRQRAAPRVPRAPARRAALRRRRTR